MAANCAPVCKYSSIFCFPQFITSFASQAHIKEFRPKLGIISAYLRGAHTIPDLVLNSRHTTTSNRESAERVLIIDAAARACTATGLGMPAKISRPRLLEFVDGASVRCIIRSTVKRWMERG